MAAPAPATRQYRRIFLLAASVALLAAFDPQPALGQNFRILEASIDEIHQAFDIGDLSCVELVEGYLDRIERFDRQGPAIHAVQTVNPEALGRARELDRLHAANGPIGALH